MRPENVIPALKLDSSIISDSVLAAQRIATKRIALLWSQLRSSQSNSRPTSRPSCIQSENGCAHIEGRNRHASLSLHATLRNYFVAAVAERFGCSPPTNAFQSPAGPLPDFRKWESCRTVSLVGGFCLGSPVFSALAIRRCSILTTFHTNWLSRLLLTLPRIAYTHSLRTSVDTRRVTRRWSLAVSAIVAEEGDGGGYKAMFDGAARSVGAMLWWCVCVQLVVAAAVVAEGDGPLLVTTQQGVLRGSVLRSRLGRNIYSFRGVRFAQPPVGALRFQQEPECGREKQCNAATHERAAKHSLHTCCDVKWPMCNRGNYLV
ncbi:hypothetical protein PR048_017507 [Dryococelus australis]|uniref:Carboxylesterase type B domain-containing protein n=1 Tax=Dryococelus australis TaxID=614101 RepID=A0ABQ9H9R2_9NEOP|nr:hypothetical protein PR048_017507 [Dryococelus australis]